MPEGPEIRRAADALAQVLVGKPLEEAWLAFEHLAAAGLQFAGQRVERLDTRGKAMLFTFSGGLHLYTHNLLWGRWMVVPRGEMPRTNRQLRVALHTSTHSCLLYSASIIEILTAAEVAQHPFLARVGPDVLDPTLTAPAIATRLGSTRFARRALAGLLLDQGCLLGVGNYLRCEALFLAGLHPSRTPSSCSMAQLEALGEALLEVTRRGYETGGRTVRPEEQRGRARPRHYVFRRANKPCLRCAAPVVGSVHGGRPLFVCATCQPASASAGRSGKRCSPHRNLG